MPIIIQEVVITTHIEKSKADPKTAATEGNNSPLEEVVKQAVEKVMDILEEKKQR